LEKAFGEIILDLRLKLLAVYVNLGPITHNVDIFVRNIAIQRYFNKKDNFEPQV